MSTYKDIELYSALGYKLPNYLHYPMLKNKDGKKQTGPRLSSEPKFDPIKKGKKPPHAACRDYQNCISIKSNHNCSCQSQNPPLHMGISPGEKLKKTNRSATVVRAKIRPDQ